MFTHWIESLWYRRFRGWWVVAGCLYPLSFFYRVGHYWRWWRVHPHTYQVPIVVIGNYTVGGSGKTPLIIALAQSFMAQGKRVGVLTHGHRAKFNDPREIFANDSAEQVGDEAALIFLKTRSSNKTGAMIWIGRPRNLALKQMINKHPEINIILVDDGLQDPSFARVGEIVWAQQGAKGNGFLIPAGPLRQPWDNVERPSEVALHRLLLSDSRINANSVLAPQNVSLGTYPLDELHLTQRERGLMPWSHWQKQNGSIYLITTIARPWRVVEMLAQHGIKPIAHHFPDHYPLTLEHIINAVKDSTSTSTHVLVTEKDAIKLMGFEERHKNDAVKNSLSINVIDYQMIINASILETVNTWTGY